MGRLRDEAVRAKWRALIQEQQRSGKTTAGFCREHGVSPPQFFWWKRRLGEGAPAEFVEVKLASAPELEVRLRSGRGLVLRPGIDLAWVREVAAALEEQV